MVFTLAVMAASTGVCTRPRELFPVPVVWQMA